VGRCDDNRQVCEENINRCNVLCAFIHAISRTTQTHSERRSVAQSSVEPPPSRRRVLGLSTGDGSS
jgi:hypothetical protein